MSIQIDNFHKNKMTDKCYLSCDQSSCCWWWRSGQCWGSSGCIWRHETDL